MQVRHLCLCRWSEHRAVNKITSSVKGYRVYKLFAKIFVAGQGQERGTWQRFEPCAYVTNGKALVVRDTQDASHAQTDLTDGRIHGQIVQAPIFEHLDRPASDASAGKINTAACSPSSAMPIPTRWESPTRPTDVYYSSQDNQRP